MAVKKIDHVGVAVKSGDDIVSFFEEKFGAKLVSKKMEETQKLVSYMVQLGDSTFEFMESTDPEGVIAKFIESKGEGIHHLSLQVDDLEATVKALSEKGIKIIGKQIEEDRKFAFIHPKSAHGVLIELMERKE